MGESSIFFEHVHLISKDPRSAAKWYAEKLSGEIVKDVELRGAPQIWVKFDGAYLFIRGERPDESAAKRTGFRWGVDHFAFGVNGNFDVYCNELKQKGVTFSLDPMDFTPQVRIAYIEAPDGVTIELTQRKS